MNLLTILDDDVFLGRRYNKGDYNMHYPCVAYVRLKTEEEQKVLLAALQDAADDHGSATASVIARIISGISYHDGSGLSERLPEAYVIVDGSKRVGEGRLVDMEKRFQIEIAGHSAAVVLYARDDGSATYRSVRSRRPQNVGG